MAVNCVRQAIDDPKGFLAEIRIARKKYALQDDSLRKKIFHYFPTFDTILNQATVEQRGSCARDEREYVRRLVNCERYRE